MTTAEETRHCEIELERSKRNFHEDLSQIGQKLHDTRVQFSPTHVIGEKSLLISGIGLLLGFLVANRDLIQRVTHSLNGNR